MARKLFHKKGGCGGTLKPEVGKSEEPILRCEGCGERVFFDTHPDVVVGVPSAQLSLGTPPQGVLL